MEYAKLESAANACGRKIGMMRKNIYRLMAQAIPEDAEIAFVTEGLSGANPVPVVVTEKNVYIMAHKGVIGVNAATIKREKITDVSLSGTILATVEIELQGKSYVIEKMAMPDAQRLAGILA
jgi:hypothetical protein